MNIHSVDRMFGCRYCNMIFGNKKDIEKHVYDMHISHSSSSESNAITSKKGEEYQIERSESTLIKRMTEEEKARKRTRGPYRKSSSM